VDDTCLAEQKLYWITDGIYRSAFLTNSVGAVLLDAPLDSDRWPDDATIRRWIVSGVRYSAAS
jgi:hypothetical protein